MATDEIRRRVSFSTSTVDDISNTAKKRRSPSSPSSQNPFSKKLNLLGFTSVPVHITSPPNSPDIAVQTPSPESESAASPSSSDLSSGIGPNAANSTKLNRIKEIIREMSQWCDGFVQDNEDIKDESVISERSDGFVQDTENVKGDNHGGDETVSIDRRGDGFIIKMNCSCGKDYQILLSDSKVYYKL